MSGNYFGQSFVLHKIIEKQSRFIVCQLIGCPLNFSLNVFFSIDKSIGIISMSQMLIWLIIIFYTKLVDVRQCCVSLLLSCQFVLPLAIGIGFQFFNISNKLVDGHNVFWAGDREQTHNFLVSSDNNVIILWLSLGLLKCVETTS